MVINNVFETSGEMSHMVPNEVDSQCENSSLIHEKEYKPEDIYFIFILSFLSGFGLYYCIFLIHTLFSRTCLSTEKKNVPLLQYPKQTNADHYVFSCNVTTIYCTVVSIITTATLWFIVENSLEHMKRRIAFLVSVPLTIGFFIYINLKKKDKGTSNAISIKEFQSLGYGNGMAYNYFYGYLTIVLPPPEIGNDCKGLVQRIVTYVNSNGLEPSRFPVKKLFILIPQNLYTPNDLTLVSKDSDLPDNENWMENAKCLEAQILDRAGVKSRHYKNSVYKIRNPNIQNCKPVYVVAEGATPLKTLYDVITKNPKMSALFKKNRHDIVSAFYRTLEEILQDSDDCRELCEIIYYEEKLSNNKPANVARIILQRISELTGKDTSELFI